MCGEPKFKIGDRVKVSRAGAKLRPAIKGLTGVVVKPGPKDSYWDVRVRFDGKTRSQALDEGFFTKVRGKK
jgi:hypothetical protein